jgi:small-conductance mechanosensitive channel
LVAVILTLPIGESSRNQLLSLLGLLVTAAIALSSTTFVGNAMAGLMLRAVRNFAPGDMLRVGEHFGRVTERHLLHTEIQTEDRDLMTLPNLYLVTKPVQVVSVSGTVVAATVSLGYDIPRARIEELLLAAATRAELEEPFVQVCSLGDFSVTYRVAGFLPDVRLLLTTRSRLHAFMLDALHGGGIEIVSPNFMNQRVLAADRLFIPEAGPPPIPRPAATAPEDKIFDKAEKAAEKTRVREALLAADQRIEQLKKSEEEVPGSVISELAKLYVERQALAKELARLEDEEPT